MLWARTERTFCTRAHRAAAPHCRPCRVPHMALARPQSSALTSPTLHATSGALQRRRQSLWRHAGVGSELLPWTAPPKPPARASCPMEQLELVLEPVGTRSSPPRRPVATERRSPAFLSTAAAGLTSSAYIRGPRDQPSTQATSFYPPSAPNTQQSTSGSFLPRLRPVRSPPQSSAVRHNRTLARPSNATNRLPIVLRSCLAPQPRPRTTIARSSLCSRTSVRRRARRR